MTAVLAVLVVGLVVVIALWVVTLGAVQDLEDERNELLIENDRLRMAARRASASLKETR